MPTQTRARVMHRTKLTPLFADLPARDLTLGDV